jgi:hypothetical protein
LKYLTLDRIESLTLGQFNLYMKAYMEEYREGWDKGIAVSVHALHLRFTESPRAIGVDIETARKV